MGFVKPGIRFKFRPTKLQHNDVILQFNIKPMAGVDTTSINKRSPVNRLSIDCRRF